MKTVAILTSGGDSPGMNSAIFHLYKELTALKIKVLGVEQGLKGLSEGKFKTLSRPELFLAQFQPGSTLRTSRFPEFKDLKIRKKCYTQLTKQKIDGLIILGGDGSFQGGSKISTEYNIPVFGIPCTIDNDIKGTNYTLGFDSAVNQSLRSIQELILTAASHERVFVLEAMGNKSGAITKACAESLSLEYLVPEKTPNYSLISKNIKANLKSGIYGQVVMITENQPLVKEEILKVLKSEGLDVRFNSIGHIVRGGVVSAYDRLWAQQAAKFITQLILDKSQSGYVCSKSQKMWISPFSELTYDK